MKAYLSHQIRGQKGKDVTFSDMVVNCNLAIVVGKQIRRLMPHLKLHIPAEHEEFVNRAYENKFLTEKQILTVDCQIINNCDLVFVYVPNAWIGGGTGIEIRHAQKKHIPIYFIFYPDKRGIKEVVDIVKHDFQN